MYSDTIPLPSQGYFYEGKPEYVKIFYITTEDELNFTAINNFAKGDSLKNLLVKNVCEPNNLKYEDLLIHDRDYLLLFLKDNAYGYILDYKAPTGKTSVYFDSHNVNITNIQNYPDDGNFYTYRFNGKVFKIKQLKTPDEKRINKKSRLSFYIEHIDSIDGNTDRKYIAAYVNRLSLFEIKKIKKFIDSIGFGVDRNTFAIIDGKRTKIELSIDEMLFGLSIENLGRVSKGLNDSISFLMNEGNGFTMEGILKMPTHIRKFHEERLMEKINKINDNMKNSK